MKIYLAGSVTKEDEILLKEYGLKYFLQTFYDLRSFKDEKVQRFLKLPSEEFLLDSGAFTFMNSGKEVNWKKYTDEYISFINKWEIKQFIELDLDHVLGVEKTIKIRKYLEYHTGRKSIPVFHAIRGMKYFREMCSEYPYIAIAASGIVKGIDEYVKNKKLLIQLLKIAHSYGCKVHGLAYTRLSNINTLEVPFDSVDSTAWLSGARYGTWYDLRHGKIKQTNKAGYGIDGVTFNRNNAKIWVEIQKEKSKEDYKWIV